MAYRAAGLGMIIMAAGGFAKYMDHIGATDAMVAVCIKPLKLLKAPYLVLALGYAVGQVLNIFIPSAAGLAMLLLVTFYPTLVRLGVSRAAAAAMIGTTAVLDLGPASGASNLAAKTAGLDVAVYFASHQIPVAIFTILAISALTYFTARYFDKRDGHVVTVEDSQSEEAANGSLKQVPAFYAILPMIPLGLLLVFSKLLITGIKMDVVTAMIIGMLLGMLCEAIRTRDMRAVLKGIMAFFDGMGHMFARIVSLIICAETFAAGLKTIGAVGFMIAAVQDAGFGVTVMTLLMCGMVAATAIITGSGNAAFFSFGNLVPDIAAKFGASAVSMLLPMQLTAGLARSMSPVAGRHHRGQRRRPVYAVRDRPAHRHSGRRRSAGHHPDQRHLRLSPVPSPNPGRGPARAPAFSLAAAFPVLSLSCNRREGRPWISPRSPVCSRRPSWRPPCSRRRPRRCWPRCC